MKGFLKKEDKQGWKPCPAAAISSMTWWVLSVRSSTPQRCYLRDLSLTHQTPSTAGHFSHSTCCHVPKHRCFPAQRVVGQGQERVSKVQWEWRETNPGKRALLCPQKTCRIRLFQGPNFSPALHLARKAFQAPHVGLKIKKSVSGMETGPFQPGLEGKVCRG